ncbi:hypothetical protein [Paraburkholderia sp. EG304]|uniref:hypothetical protein n=1 Tax=Paraburkholderia sp. EG304 TaxID=3237015 RepID=UPI00397AF8AB
MTAITMATLPAISDARLPDTYQSAVMALEKATAIDECQAWADKAMALASYARQSRDDRLQKMAVRIQARATRRCGELLATVPPATGTRSDIEPRAGDCPKLTREQAAADANMSPHQRKTALRVAAVPRAEFERQVESDAPPTITTLAEQGKKIRPLVDLGGIPPEDYANATRFQGAVARLAELCETQDAARVARALQPHERKSIRDRIAVIDAWLDQFAVNLPE